MKKIYILMVSVLLAACSSDEIIQMEQEAHEFTLTTDVLPFEGETSTTRSNLEGTGFEDGDWIRLKIICPFVSSSEYGESTWGNSYDAFFLLKRKDVSSWVPLDTADHCDINGTYNYGNSPQVGNFYEAQQTPYVYMASTWTEEKNFKTSSGKHILQYCHVFHADQRKEQNYKASDLLWAQQYMQTGAWNVHLNFEHKMACLTFEIDDSQLTDANGNAAPLSNDAILTLEGMPDIDQQEIVVGDYYADASKINSDFGYRQKASCSYANNGKVLGIGVNVDADSRAKVAPMTGNPVPGGAYASLASAVLNTGTYTAYKEVKKDGDQIKPDHTHYRMIVPPCVLKDTEGNLKHAQIWIRDGERRFKMQLDRTEFREGELYHVKVKL